MRKVFCDICGKEIEKGKVETCWPRGVVTELHDYPIDDICLECSGVLYACLIMMKETGWRPDFHEKLNSESIFESDCAGYTLSKLEDRTKLKLF